MKYMELNSVTPQNPCVNRTRQGSFKVSSLVPFGKLQFPE